MFSQVQPQMQMLQNQAPINLYWNQNQMLLQNQASAGVDVAEFLLGFVEGGLDSLGGEHISECINGSEDAIKSIGEIHDIFKSNKGLTAIKKAVHPIYDLTKGLYTAAKNCGFVESDLVKLSKMTFEIADPETLPAIIAKNITLHAEGLVKGAIETVRDVEKHKW